MRKRPGSLRGFAAAILAAGASPLLAGSPISALRPAGPARVTIRGTGSAISVERSAEPARRRSPVEASPAVLARAVGMKQSGTSDEALVWFLAAHRSELPAFVDFDTVSALRDAGAGGSVIAYLASVAAVEVGPTGAEGGSRDEPAVGAPPREAEMTNELPASLAWGGIVIGPPSRGFRRHGFHSGRGSFPRGIMRGRSGLLAPRSSGVRPRR